MRAVDAFVSADGRSAICILQLERIIDVLPAAVGIRKMNGRTVLHGSIASVSQTEPFAGLGALLIYFADYATVRIDLGDFYCIGGNGIYGWQQLNEHCCRQRHRKEFGK